MLNAWSDFKGLGVLPYGGSDLMEQPAFILEAFKIIEDQKTETELKQTTESNKRAARRS